MSRRPLLHSASITELHDGRKLFLGAEFERGALVQDDLFVGPPMERSREFAAAKLQAESYVERKHNARRTAPGVAHATSGIKANVLTAALSRATSSILTHKVRVAKRWNKGNRVPITRVPITMSGSSQRNRYRGRCLISTSRRKRA